MKKGAFLILLILIANQLLAQIEVNFTSEFDDMQNINSIWALQFINTGQQRYILLEAFIRDENQIEYYHGISNSIEIQSGITQLSNNALIHINVIFDKIAGIGDLPENKYLYEIIVKDANTNQALSIATKHKIVSSSQTNIQGNKIIGDRTGNIRFTYHYNENNSDPQTNYRPQYFVSNAVVNADILTVPIQINWLISNNGTDINQPFRQIKFSVDTRKIQQRKKEKLIKQLTEKESFNKGDSLDSISRLKSGLISQKYKNLVKWKSELQEADYNKIKKDNAKYTVVENALTNKTFTDNKEKLEKLKTLYSIKDENDLKKKNINIPEDSLKKIKRLFAIQHQYEKLSVQKDSLSKIKNKIKRLERIAKKVKQAENSNWEGLISNTGDIPDNLGVIQQKQKGVKGFLEGIKQFQIGSTYPFYSRHSISSVRVDGVDISHISNTKLYKEITFGQTKYKSINTTHNTSNYYYPQYLLGCKLGYGSDDESHFHIFYLSFFDKDNKTSQNENGATEKSKCQNIQTGAEFQIIAFQNKVKMIGEIETSLFTPNTNMPIRVKRKDELLLIPFTEHKLRQESVIGFSGKIETRAILNDKNTELFGMVDYYGPGYHSLGVLTDFQDLLRYNFKINQNFKKKVIKTSFFYQKDFDNLSPMQAFETTVTTCYGVSISYNYKKRSSISLDYRPYYQQKKALYDTSSKIVLPQGQIIQLLSSHFSHIDRVSFQSQIGANYQYCNTWGLNNKNAIITYLINEVVTKGILSIMLSCNYAPETKIGNSKYKNIYLSSNLQINFKHKYPFSLGYSSNTQASEIKRKSFYLRLSLPISSKLSFETTALYNKTYPNEVTFSNKGFSGWSSIKLAL